jgi:hypothetical protein
LLGGVVVSGLREQSRGAESPLGVIKVADR